MSKVSAPSESDGAVALLEQTPELDAARQAGGQGHSQRRLVDLGACLAVAIVALAASSVPVIGIPVGLVAVLIVPGYALSAALFPTDEHGDIFERLALALALSIGVVAILALLLDRAPGGLSARQIRIATTATSAVLVVIAYLRRRRLPAPPADAPRARALAGPTSRVVRFTQALVVASVAAAAFAYAIAVADQPPTPTAFYIVGASGKMADYPTEAILGDRVILQVGVQQGSARPGNYTITVLRDGSPLTTTQPLQVRPGESWEGEITISPDRVGPDQEILLRLTAPGDSAALRTLRIWMNVSPPSPT